MQLDVGDVAGLLAGYKAGEISADAANRLLRQWDVTGSPTVDALLSLGVGVAVGGIVGSFVDDIFDGFF